jgi:acetyltransferase-like isoleucine patch superfamily enzyme
MLLRIYHSLQKRINARLRDSFFNTDEYSVKVGHGFKFDFLKSDFLIRKKGILLAKENVVIRNFSNILIYEGAKLELGNNVFFNRYCSINCLGSIVIGDDTIFGEGVKLYDHNHKFKDPTKAIRLQGSTIGSITIGKNCWIGANVTILNNVTIGDNVVIGAGNLIYKSVPSDSIVKNKAQYLIEEYRTLEE